MKSIKGENMTTLFPHLIIILMIVSAIGLSAGLSANKKANPTVALNAALKINQDTIDSYERQIDNTIALCSSNAKKICEADVYRLQCEKDLLQSININTESISLTDTSTSTCDASSAAASLLSKIEGELKKAVNCYSKAKDAIMYVVGHHLFKYTSGTDLEKPTLSYFPTPNAKNNLYAVIKDLKQSLTAATTLERKVSISKELAENLYFLAYRMARDCGQY